MTPNDPRTDRRGIVRRFGYYFIGVAIGLVMLGVLQTLKHANQRPAPQPSTVGEPAQSGG